MHNSTLAHLEALLIDRGYATRLDDSVLLVPVTTVAYRNPAGQPAAMISLNVDSEQGCLQVALPWAFDGKRAVNQDVLHRFLFEAARAAPLVKALLDPNDGEVRLRIDLTLGPDGVRDDDVLRGIQLLRACAEEWHQPITSAMASGTFEAPRPPAADRRTTASERLDHIARRAGGRNRLRVLFEFARRLERERNNQKEESDGDHAG